MKERTETKSLWIGGRLKYVCARGIISVQYPALCIYIKMFPSTKKELRA